MNCKLFRDTLDAYLADTLSEDRRSALRGHLRDCASCRVWAVAQDPTVLFAAVDEPPVDRDRAELCAASVTAAIRQQRLRRRLSAAPWRPWLAAAAAIVVAVGGVLVWRLLPGSAQTGRAGEEARGSSELPAPTVEVEMPSEDVRVYQFANGDDPDTAVVFIVDPALEL